MMLSKFVRAQLIIFSILTVIGVVAMATIYVQVPAMLGIGRYGVTVKLASTGGLYKNANVAYRGTNIGKVEEVRLTPDGVDAKLSIESSYKIPSDLEAWVKSVSAVGEQYVDLIPNTSSGPDLGNGDVIPVERTKLPQDVGPMLDQADRLLAGVADTRLQTVIDEAFNAFNGTGPDLQKLLDSARLFIQEANSNVDQTKTLIDQIGPLLDTQNDTSDDIRAWTQNLARFTDQLRRSDPQLRSLLERGPGVAAQADKLFQDLKPTLPLLLANLVSVGQVGVIYHASIEQLLVLYPPIVAALITAATNGPRDEGALVDFQIQFNDPPACTTGFLPTDQRRSGKDITVPDTPTNLFCKVPQDDPIAVRGARNAPCMEVPGKRAATPEQCKSEEGYVPLGTNPPFGPPQPVAPGAAAPASYEPSTTAKQYDAQTGTFIGSDGKTYSQPGIAPGGAARTPTDWKTMMTEQQGK
ncbi:MCE family protein [Antrihabitans cavernicola]|uniref:MCE family protein n=1 Tax=Antrihabitans cavernicola TaxID=2495913 RepID=A0A5A7S8X2_9NOCA|nr:MlaD family protein [Spelaeibacter cavernicola]KAA0021934.1 MCE family protein [Spelaeibacter cavernicola]